MASTGLHQAPPSPPSHGGEGWGEEVRFYWFPLSSVLSPLVPRGERMESLMQPWGKGRLASPCSRMPSELLCGGRAQRLLRRASPSGLFPENSAPRSFQTGSHEWGLKGRRRFRISHCEKFEKARPGVGGPFTRESCEMHETVRGQRRLGRSEQSSLMFAYVRVCSLSGRKMFEDVRRFLPLGLMWFRKSARLRVCVW